MVLLKPRYKTIFLIAKVLVGLIFLYFAVRYVNWKELITDFRSVSLTYLVVATISVIFGLFLKLWRWVILTKNYGIKSNLITLCTAYFSGQAVNIILPVRGGEIVRMGVLAAGNKYLLPEIGSTILIEKYMDLLGLTICAFLVSVEISIEPLLNLHGWFIPVSLAVTIGLLAFIIIGPLVWQKIRGWKVIPSWLYKLLDQWVIASQWMRKPKRVISIFVVTALIWVVMWFTNYLLFRAQELALGGTAAGLVLVMVYIGLLPALMPGNIGPFYYFAQLALLPFGINHNTALAYAILLHAIVTLPPLIGGAVFIFIRSKQPKNNY
ncbi:MAG: lysylphosphatidylglycerol synthase transmembrane domain-containing protein [Anaerolineaceae bacterium]